MNTPLRSTALAPNPAVDGAPITEPDTSAPAAAVGQRDRLPSARTKRPAETTCAVASGDASSIFAVSSATRLPPVGPTDSDSSLCLRPWASSEHVSLLNSPGVPLANPQAGIR